MINKVFAGFGLPNDVTKDTIDDALLQAVKFGNNKNIQRITISDGTLKTFVPGMVSFLEMYYGEVTITFDVYLSKKDNIEEPIIKFIPVKEEL